MYTLALHVHYLTTHYDGFLSHYKVIANSIYNKILDYLQRILYFIYFVLKRGLTLPLFLGGGPFCLNYISYQWPHSANYHTPDHSLQRILYFIYFVLKRGLTLPLFLGGGPFCLNYISYQWPHSANYHTPDHSSVNNFFFKSFFREGKMEILKMISEYILHSCSACSAFETLWNCHQIL